jgi:hypothetical protein
VPSKVNAFSAYFTAAHYIRPKSDDEIAKHYEPIQASNLNEIGIVQGCTAPDATRVLVSTAAAPQMAQKAFHGVYAPFFPRGWLYCGYAAVMVD